MLLNKYLKEQKEKWEGGGVNIIATCQYFVGIIEHKNACTLDLNIVISKRNKYMFRGIRLKQEVLEKIY